MNATVKNRIDEIKVQGYQIDFGAVFNQTIENYKKIALYGGLVLFVFLIVFGLVLGGLFAGFVGTDEAARILQSKELQSENLDITSLLMLSGVSLLIAVLISPFIAGLYKMAHNADKDDEFHVSTMFHYYNSSHFVDIIIASVVLGIADLIIKGVINYLEIPILAGFLSAVVSFFTFLTIPLIIFGNVRAIDAIKASIMIISKQPFVLLGLILVGVIAVLLGLFGCCIGIIFTIPLLYSMGYIIYKYIIGFPENNEEEVITNFDSL